MKLRLGRVDYLNCLPVYYAFEKKLVLPNFPLKIVKGVPTYLNGLFLAGELDVTPLSSIEYARHPEAGYILPDISVSADGPVGSIFLFSRLPVTELEGAKIAVADSSATSVALLHVLLEHYYQVRTTFLTRPPNLEAMLQEAEAALLIGDDAMVAAQRVKDEGLPLHVTDLGRVWKEFTGEKMVFALWVVRREFAAQFPKQTTVLAGALVAAEEESMRRLDELVTSARRRTGLPRPVIEEYFRLIRYGFDASYQRALLLFYDYAYKSGLIEDRIKTLAVWGQNVG